MNNPFRREVRDLAHCVMLLDPPNAEATVKLAYSLKCDFEVVVFASSHSNSFDESPIGINVPIREIDSESNVAKEFVGEFSSTTEMRPS